MLKIYTYFAFLLLLGGSVAGCKKNDDAAPSRTDLLTNKNWVVTAATVSPGINIGNGVVVTDIYAQESACQKDDITIFQTPNVLKEDEGATKCSASDPQTTTGTWSFNSDQSVITTTDSSGTENLTIKTLDTSNLVVTTTVVSNNVTYTVTISYHHS